MRWAPVVCWCTAAAAWVTCGQASRVFSISPSSMRCPRSLIWVSARPRQSSVPAGVQRTRSPVRYIRAPAPPVGVGHEPFRGQLGPAHIAARQRGPGQIQLADHPDRGRVQPGIQHQRAHPGIGAPMLTGCPADSGALQVAQMVVSVGP